MELNPGDLEKLSMLQQQLKRRWNNTNILMHGAVGTNNSIVLGGVEGCLIVL
jgi:hypothetical protein